MTLNLTIDNKHLLNVLISAVQLYYILMHGNNAYDILINFLMPKFANEDDGGNWGIPIKTELVS